MDLLHRGQNNGYHSSRGNSEPEVAGTCNTCKSVIECLQTELKTMWPGDQRDGPSGMAKCPVCSKHMNFYPKSGR